MGSEVVSDALAFLAGGGEAARMIRERDWSGHPLGPPETWPEGFRTALSLVLNSPESMILTWGPELHFFFNDTYFPLLGPRLEWAMGERFDVVWADAWEQAKPIIDDAFAGRSHRFDDLPWKLGTDRGEADTWFSFSYSRVLDGAGRVAGLFIFTNETTARVLGDRALRESEEHYRQTVELNPQVPWTCDPEGNITSYSNRWLELTGQAPGRAGRSRLDSRHCTRTTCRGTLAVFGLRWPRASRWTSITACAWRRRASTAGCAPAPAPAGTRAAASCAGTAWSRTSMTRSSPRRALREMNETLERRVEEALLQRKLWAEVFETTDALVGALDNDFRILAANRAWIEGFEAVSGIRPRIGDASSTCCRTDPDCSNPVREDLGTGAGRRGVHARRGVRRSGPEATLLRDEVHDPAGPEGRAGSAPSSTSRTSPSGCGTRSGCSTAEEALRQSQKMEAVGQLTGGVAHDFNNLLTIIRSSVDFLRRPDLPEERRTRYMDAVSDTVDRAAKLTGQLLAFARRQALKPEVFDVGGRLARRGRDARHGHRRAHPRRRPRCRTSPAS